MATVEIKGGSHEVASKTLAIKSTETEITA